jgi:hypothetical protein
MFGPDELLAVPSAIDALAGVRVGSLRVLGIDAFIEPLHPTLDYIADFSNTTDPRESVQRAIDTLQSWPDSLLVEIVTEDWPVQ